MIKPSLGTLSGFLVFINIWATKKEFSCDAKDKGLAVSGKLKAIFCIYDYKFTLHFT